MLLLDHQATFPCGSFVGLATFRGYVQVKLVARGARRLSCVDSRDAHDLSMVEKQRSVLTKMRNLLGILVAVAIAPIVFLSPVSAQPAEVNSTVIVLDVSESMGEVAGPDGLSKLEVAQNAINEVIEGLEPGSVNVGLRTFGVRITFFGLGRIECSTQRPVPVGPLDPGAFSEAVDGLTADGLTAIELALDGAVSDLRFATGERSVILITDGRERCGGDPCGAAQDLAAEGSPITISTVGFLTNSDEANADLECIAEATGGTNTLANHFGDVFGAVNDALGSDDGSDDGSAGCQADAEPLAFGSVSVPASFCVIAGGDNESAQDLGELYCAANVTDPPAEPGGGYPAICWSTAADRQTFIDRVISAAAGGGPEAELVVWLGETDDQGQLPSPVQP